MSTESFSWSLTSFSKWLRQVGDRLRESGFQVDVQETSEFTPSIRMRVEGKQLLGELIVWDTSISYQGVGSLESGDWLFESDGTFLKGKPYETALGTFLSYFLQ